MAVLHKRDVYRAVDLAFFIWKVYVLCAFILYLPSCLRVCVSHVIVELSEGTVRNPGRPSKISF